MHVCVFVHFKALGLHRMVVLFIYTYVCIYIYVHSPRSLQKKSRKLTKFHNQIRVICSTTHSISHLHLIWAAQLRAATQLLRVIARKITWCRLQPRRFQSMRIGSPNISPNGPMQTWSNGSRDIASIFTNNMAIYSWSMRLPADHYVALMIICYNGWALDYRTIAMSCGESSWSWSWSQIWSNWRISREVKGLFADFQVILLE